MDYRRVHQHAGRPQFLLWYGRDPVLVDGGCVSYDKWEFLMTMESDQEGFVHLAPVENGENRIDYDIVFGVTETGRYENRTVLTFEDRRAGGHPGTENSKADAERNV